MRKFDRDEFRPITPNEPALGTLVWVETWGIHFSYAGGPIDERTGTIFSVNPSLRTIDSEEQRAALMKERACWKEFVPPTREEREARLALLMVYGARPIL